jgi:spore coat protein CotH
MDTNEKRILCALIGLALVLGVLAIGQNQHLFRTHDDRTDPFDKSRVTTVRIVMAERDWQSMKSNARAKQYMRGDFWFDGKRYPNVAVRAKGMSSLMSVADGRSKRLPLKVDFNFFNSSRSFRGLTKVCLNNGFSDPTFIREMIGYEQFEQMDIPTPRCCFVNLYVNGDHLGLYTMAEPIDKNFLQRHYSNPNGNLYKPEMSACNLNWTKADYEKQKASQPNNQNTQKRDSMAINIGGSRLNDLLRLLKRENGDGDPNEGRQMAGPFGGGPGGPGGFDGGPGGGFPGGPMGPGGPGGFGPGQMGQGGPGGMAPVNPMSGGRVEDILLMDPDEFERGLNRPGFGMGPGGGFPGGPMGRGGPGGPMGMFGRGGDLVETMGLRTNENYANHDALFRFLEVLNKTPDETFAEEIETVLDVDQVLRFLAVSVMLVHLDNYIGMGHNYYLYEINGKFTVLPWDLNMAFGTFGGGPMQGGGIADFLIDEPVSGNMNDRPLVKRLMAHKPYLDKYHAYLAQMLKEGFAPGKLESRIDELIAMVRPFVEKDEAKFFTMEQFEKGITEDSSGDMMRPGGMGGFGGPGPQGAQADADIPSDMPDDLAMLVAASKSTGGDNQRMARGGPPGMGAPGLKPFISKRRISVQAQLDGTRVSKLTDEQRQQQGQRGPMMMGPGGMR